VNDDQLRRRLQAADPAHHVPQTDSWIPDLVEDTMRTSTDVPLSNRRWVPALAGAAAIAVIGVGTYVVLGQDDLAPRPEPTAMVLSMPDTGTSMPSCIPFAVDVLRDMPVAFSGTATDVAEDTRWIWATPAAAIAPGGGPNADSLDDNRTRIPGGGPTAADDATSPLTVDLPCHLDVPGG
jgi:hypothetical protein